MNNKGADQPAHPRSLISAFVIPVLESTFSKLAISEISIFYLVSLADETGLSLALSETPKTGFSRAGPFNNYLKSCRPLDKSVLLKISSHIFQSKNMLWVLKRTV